MEKDTSRNYGIDLLRVIAMFMIVVHHLLYWGGALVEAKPLSRQYWMAWGLEICAYSAVNCFAIISGYCMYNKKQDIARIFRLWLEMAFYGILITIITFFVVPEARSFRFLIEGFVPVSSVKWWYLSAYFGMLLLQPVLNVAISIFEQKMLKRLLFIAFFFTSIMQVLVYNKDPYKISGGYSTLWLLFLYLVGGYIHKYKIYQRISTKKIILYISCLLVVTFLSKVILEHLSMSVFGEIRYGELLIAYNSPTILMIAILNVYLFAGTSINSFLKGTVKLIAPSALAIYLIHEQEYIREFIIKGCTKSLVEKNALFMGGTIIVYAVGICICCVCLDTLRRLLFYILHVDCFSRFISDKVNKMYKLFDI